MKTMNIKEAAAFLKVHPVTLSMKASAGEIQGAKIGKCWVFLEVDLIEHIRSKYSMRALQSERKETLCHSTNAKTLQHGGLKSPLLVEQYNEALGLKTKTKPKNSTTS